MGKNSEFESKGMRYHIQTESWAPEERVFVSQVFLQGRVILKEKTPIVGSQNNQIEQELNVFHQSILEKVKSLLI